MKTFRTSDEWIKRKPAIYLLSNKDANRFFKNFLKSDISIQSILSKFQWLGFVNGRYYTSLPRELIVRFFHVFRLDFELFDYSIDDVLLMGGHAPLQETEL